jgi:hypothetical protein
VSACTSRRVTVEVIVKAPSQREAVEIVRGRMNEWFVDPSQRELEADFGYPVGTLIHYTVRNVTGHRQVAA